MRTEGRLRLLATLAQRDVIEKILIHLELPTAPPEAAPLAPTPLTRGIIRKSAVRRWLKTEAAQPVKIREAFFAALEAKVTADLARSLARAREEKRSTLMGSDA